MTFTNKNVSRLIWCLSMLVVFLLVLLSVKTLFVSTGQDVGVNCVKLMYQFQTPDELVENQSRLREVLTQNEYERLSVDNELRVVNAYYKFGYNASRVRIEDTGDGFVVYSIENDNIDPDQLWVFTYEVDSSGKLYNIREYRAILTYEGGSMR